MDPGEWTCDQIKKWTYLNCDEHVGSDTVHGKQHHFLTTGTKVNLPRENSKVSESSAGLTGWNLKGNLKVAV